MKTRRSLFIFLPLAVLTSSCSGEPPAPESGDRVEAADLGIALATVPVPFRTAPGADGLQLDADPDGRVAFAVGPDTGGVNLVAEVNGRAEAFEEIEAGEFHGQLELGTPWGPAFYARGSYPAGEGRTEETWIYALHPGEPTRLLTLTYTYAAGTAENSKARVNQLMELLGEIEALPR